MGGFMRDVNVAFLAGISAATFLFSGVFFLRFWKLSRDRFFLYFALSCGLIAFERLVVLTLDGTYHFFSEGSEGLAWVYLIRLTAFALLIFAIIVKNRTPSPR
jgi:hypothetical protein